MDRRRQQLTICVVELLVALIFSSNATAQGAKDEGQSIIPALSDKKALRSYAAGMAIARQLQTHSAKIDADLLIQGLKDTLAGSQTLVTPQEAQAALAELQRELKTQSAAVRQEKAETNARDGQNFLSEHKWKEGVVTLKSGLQYRVLKAGYGKKPTLRDVVVCQYRGRLVNGAEFDSSYSRERPAMFPLKKVIRGWREALLMMPVGSTWELVVPPALAYGARGHGKVGPNETLIFEVELLSVNDDGIQSAVVKEVKVQEAGDEILVEKSGQLSPEQATLASVAGLLTDLRVSFKVDSRLSGGTYGGELWSASLPFNSLPQGGSEATLVAKVDGVGKNGVQVPTIAEWKPSDKAMITITPGQRNQVTITVHHPGESKLTVATSGVAKELIIKATQEGNATKVVVTQ